ncbi:MAG: hypothetical protein DME55_06485 [Verrucomicrobia bacterium]|nr:MAG: hypothetical protein DME55_06485 [Verrucomicrobiota bacterium]
MSLKLIALIQTCEAHSWQVDCSTDVRDFAGFGGKSALDISRIAVIVFGDERRYSFRPSKADRLRVSARVVAIESDRFSTGR